MDVDTNFGQVSVHWVDQTSWLLMNLILTFEMFLFACLFLFFCFQFGSDFSITLSGAASQQTQ